MRSVLVAALSACSILATTSCYSADDSEGRLYDIRGSKLYITTLGNGAPIVFLHGDLLFFGNNFSKQRDYFASFRKIVGIDQQGHGHSPDRDRNLSYEEMSEDTAAVIERLGLGSVDIVGHSGGGNIGLILARQHPELVRRLVISGANLRPSLPSDELRRRRQASAEQMDAKVQEIAKKLPANFRLDYERVSPDSADHWMTMVAKAYRMWLEPVIDPAELQSIKIPVLVMAGDHDFTSIEETLEIYRSLPRGQLMVLPATGHGTLFERPELANLAIREFLESKDSEAAGR